MMLAAPERFAGYLVMNMAHPWQSARSVVPHLWRFMLYQPFVASIGVFLQTRTPYLRALFQFGPKAHRLDPAVAAVYADRFRDPVCARAGTDTYRTFLLHEVPSAARHPEERRITVPVRVLFGTGDIAVHPSLAQPSPVTAAHADDYTYEPVESGHFVIDERPDLVHARLAALAAQV